MESHGAMPFPLFEPGPKHDHCTMVMVTLAELVP